MKNKGQFTMHLAVVAIVLSGAVMHTKQVSAVNSEVTTEPIGVECEEHVCEEVGEEATGQMQTAASQVVFQVPEPVEVTLPEELEYPLFAYNKDWDANETYLLAKIAECEAGNQNIRTKELVVLVVLNRVWSEKFPNTIEEVIMQENDGVYQFSPVSPGGSWWYKEPSEDAYVAVENVMMSEYDYSGGAIFFESFKSEEATANSWHGRHLTFLYQSEDMRFYK